MNNIYDKFDKNSIANIEKFGVKEKTINIEIKYFDEIIGLKRNISPKRILRVLITIDGEKQAYRKGAYRLEEMKYIDQALPQVLTDYIIKELEDNS